MDRRRAIPDVVEGRAQLALELAGADEEQSKQLEDDGAAARPADRAG